MTDILIYIPGNWDLADLEVKLEERLAGLDAEVCILPVGGAEVLFDAARTVYYADDFDGDFSLLGEALGVPDADRWDLEVVVEGPANENVNCTHGTDPLVYLSVQEAGEWRTASLTPDEARKAAEGLKAQADAIEIERR